jgi:hypothetical protein
VAIAAVPVTVGLLVALDGGDHSLVTALLLLGCLCAMAALVGPERTGS